jgi:hypothetical protein
MIPMMLFPAISDEDQKPFTEAEKKLEKKIFSRKRLKVKKMKAKKKK